MGSGREDLEEMRRRLEPPIAGDFRRLQSVRHTLERSPPLSERLWGVFMSQLNGTVRKYHEHYARLSDEKLRKDYKFDTAKLFEYAQAGYRAFMASSTDIVLYNGNGRNP